MKRSVVFTCMCLILALNACDSLPEYSEDTGADAFLIESIPSVSAERNSEVLFFPSDSLVDYLNNAAAYFQRYGCEELATTEYMIDSILLEADIYRFTDTENAFGMYLAMRSGSYNDSNLVPLGYEGFTDQTGLTFVKGAYMANFMCFNDAGAHTDAMYRLAEYFSKVIPGETVEPTGFAALPKSYAVPGVLAYYPAAFLRFDFFPPVYYGRFAKDADSLDVFLVVDSAGPTMLKMLSAIGDSARAAMPEDVPFDEGKGFIYNHPQYGPLMCGIKGDKMAIFFGYTENKKPFITEWLGLLK